MPDLALPDHLSLTTAPTAAARWLRSWFDGEPDALVALTMIRTIGAASIATNITMPLPKLLDTIENREILEAATFDGGFEWNLYVSLGTYDERPARAEGRPHKEHVDHLPGVWIDLDVKPGGFRDQEHALSLLRGLPAGLRPTSVVATGTGGIHGYWNIGGAVDLGPAAIARLCEKWWAYLVERSGVHIDALTEVGRVTKLPGTIRWPKNDREHAAPVQLLYCEDPAPADASASAGTVKVRRYVCAAEIERVSEDAWARHLVHREQLVEARRAKKREAAALLPRGPDGWPIMGRGSLARMASLVHLADAVQDTLDWEDVLTPLGWTELRPDSEERRIWARPGGEDRKAASTDYRGSHVMTLFSDAEETGLHDLVESGAVLTRYNVVVELWYGGDEAALVTAWNAAGGNVGALHPGGSAADRDDDDGSETPPL